MGPTTQPICATLQARDNTPDPITAVITCADAVQTVPAQQRHTRILDDSPHQRLVCSSSFVLRLFSSNFDPNYQQLLFCCTSLLGGFSSFPCF
jgi:hypothetical protein